MKTKLLIILLCLLFTRTFKAQNQLMFNTAISWPNYNSLIPALNTVNGWSVSLGATPGTYVHTVRSANPGWCAPTTNSDWMHISTRCST